MARMALRSPYFITRTAPSTALSVQLIIKINNVTKYTLLKLVTGGQPVSFEVSELCRDYLNITYDGSPVKEDTQIEVDLEGAFYNTPAPAGTPISLFSETDNIAFDAYGYFNEGTNPSPPFYLSSGGAFLIAPKLGTTTEWEIFVPEGVGGFVPKIQYVPLPTPQRLVSYTEYFANTTQIQVAVGEVCTINRLPCSKYEPQRITFVNKYGQFQDLWFALKKVLTTSTTKEEYQGINLISSGSATTYDVSVPTKVVYNKESKERITLSSGYYPEGYNAVFEQLLESEQIWIQTVDQAGTTQYLPLNVMTSSFVKKTKLNDRLIDYTIEFAEAYDKINNVR